MCTQFDFGKKLFTAISYELQKMTRRFCKFTFLIHEIQKLFRKITFPTFS